METPFPTQAHSRSPAQALGPRFGRPLITSFVYSFPLVDRGLKSGPEPCFDGQRGWPATRKCQPVCEPSPLECWRRYGNLYWAGRSDGGGGEV